MLIALEEPNRRVLVVDDEERIQRAYRTILSPGRGPRNPDFQFQLDHAADGVEALALVQRACERDRRFAVAFVDHRFPEGPTGLETIQRIWALDPDVEAVLCSAVAQALHDEIRAQFGNDHRLLVLSKPFDPIEIGYLASSLCEKWRLRQLERQRIEGLEEGARRREQELTRVVRELRQERVAHEEAEHRFRALTQSAADAILSADSTGSIVSWNGAAADMFGYTPDEVIGQSTEILMHGRHRDIIERLTHGASSLVGRPLKLEGVRKDGSEFPLELSSSTWTTKDERFVSAIIRDLTERERIEAQLLQAQKLESVGQLAAGIAHEINTPTQFIGDNITFLRRAFSLLTPALEVLEGASSDHAAADTSLRERLLQALKGANLAFLKPEMGSAIDQALEGVGRVANIVRAMKEFSHPSGGKRQPTDIHHALETTLNVARNEWRYVATITKEFDSGLPEVPCYRDDLNQVLLNILVNAAHAISEKLAGADTDLGTLTVATRRVGEYAEIRISDDGTGIPEPIRHKIFEPFFTTKPVGRGTGQGLALAHAVIVRKHGGSIEVESEVGVGSTFILRIPLDPDRSEADASDVGRPSRATSAAATGRSMT